jgi:hypothetical protein
MYAYLSTRSVCMSSARRPPVSAEVGSHDHQVQGRLLFWMYRVSSPSHSCCKNQESVRKRVCGAIQAKHPGQTDTGQLSD